MRKHYSILVLTVLMAARLGVTGAHRPTLAAGQPAEQSQSATVEIKDFAFRPATLTVAVGTKVTWINRDDEPHQLASGDKKLSSPALDTDEQYSKTFTAVGTYNYYCSLHPKMTGKVIVQ